METHDPLQPTPVPPKRKKGKTRTHWYSFASRVVAQVVGAIVSVSLALFFLQRSQAPEPVVAPAPTAPARAVSARTPGTASVVVLPLDNFSKNPEQEYFADGMTEAIIADLAQVDGLRVISRTSAMRYKGQRVTIPEIAQALNVDLVVEGSVVIDERRVRITAQLIDARSDEHLWAESYERPLGDVLALHQEVASAIAGEIKGTVTRARPTAAENVDPAVYDLYMRGRYAINRRTPEGFARGIELFELAVSKAPNYALAHVGLAFAYGLQGSPSEGLAEARARMSRAKIYATRAIELDPSLAEGHTALGGVLFFGERQFAAAESAFRRAIELNPNYPVAHEWLGLLLAERGRRDEALRHVDTAVALDPLEATMHQARGMILYNGRRFTEAAEAERKALSLTPQLPLARTLLVKSLLMQGDLAAATTECGRGELSDAGLALSCGLALHKAGRVPEAEALRRRVDDGSRPSAGRAQWLAATGDLDAAFRSMDALAESGNLPPGLAFDPLFDDLRKDARWPATAKRAGY